MDPRREAEPEPVIEPDQVSRYLGTCHDPQASVDVEILLRDGHLAIKSPAFPAALELIMPKGDGPWLLRLNPSTSVTIQQDANGRVTGYTAHVPGRGSFERPRMNPESDDRADQVEELVERLEQERLGLSIPGLALVMAGGYQLLLCPGFGLADLKTGEKVTPATLFPIGSAIPASGSGTGVTASMRSRQSGRIEPTTGRSCSSGPGPVSFPSARSTWIGRPATGGTVRREPLRAGLRPSRSRSSTG